MPISAGIICRYYWPWQWAGFRWWRDWCGRHQPQEISRFTSQVGGTAPRGSSLDSSLEKVDEFLHISRRMRTIALQSAVGGMALSALGMLLAAGGWLAPVAGAVVQEVIDIVAVLNALRVAWPPRNLADYEQGPSVAKSP